MEGTASPRFDGRYIFGGVPHKVTLSTAGGVLALSVEDEVTYEAWGAEFTARCIEDLSQKTGSFKPFSVFAHMLGQAVTHHSDAVSLELLTYGDLEALRDRKLGQQPRRAAPQPATAVGSSAREAASGGGKRYLIMTYRAEFDVVHYPLPLPATHQPGTDALRNTIHRLHQQLAAGGSASLHDASEREGENARLRATVQALQEAQRPSSADGVEPGRRGGSDGAGPAPASLRQLVGRLEEELARERTRHQRQEQRQRRAYEELLAEAEALRVAERQLRVRCRSLTNELAVRRRRGPQVGGGGAATGRRSGSAERRVPTGATQRESGAPLPPPLFFPSSLLAAQPICSYFLLQPPARPAAHSSCG